MHHHHHLKRKSPTKFTKVSINMFHGLREKDNYVKIYPQVCLSLIIRVISPGSLWFGLKECWFKDQGHLPLAVIDIVIVKSPVKKRSDDHLLPGQQVLLKLMNSIKMHTCDFCNNPKMNAFILSLYESEFLWTQIDLLVGV